MENTRSKPFIVEIDEAKSDLVQCVNRLIKEKGIPCYFLESMLSEIFEQVKVGAKNELMIAKEQVRAENQKTEVQE